MKKWIAALLACMFVFAFTAAALGAEAAGTEAAETAAPAGPEYAYAAEWEDYSVSSDEYTMLILTVYEDVELVSIRRADNDEVLDWRPGVTQTRSQNEAFLQRTYLIAIDKADETLDVIVAFSDGTELAILHGAEE